MYRFARKDLAWDYPVPVSRSRVSAFYYCYRTMFVVVIYMVRPLGRVGLSRSEQVLAGGSGGVPTEAPAYSRLESVVHRH